jgi:hypothetical protein
VKHGLRILALAWASPYTLLGLLVGLAGLATGGRARIRGPVLQFHGGAVRWFMDALPGGGFLAMTLGHVVLGWSEAALDVSYRHELVHVRQYERWGPFMGPAYLLCSLVLWMAGKRGYRDNPFERQAFDETGE